MRVDRPGPGDELSEGPGADARPAASVIVLRDTDGGVPAGTAFEDIPGDWVCPVCGARKKDFTLYEG